MRVPVEFRTASRTNYTKFCQLHPEITIDYRKWCAVIYTHAYLFRDYILATGDSAKMIWGFGCFTITKKKRKITKTNPKDGKEYVNLAVNWKASKETGKKVYYFNHHTDGYNCKWYWQRKTAHLYKAQLWSFKPSRITSRKLSEQLFKDPIFFQLYQIHK